jgi:putative endonuclease
MAGLVPAIHALDAGAPSHSVARMHGGWVYIMTNRPNGTLYTGVTADIARRAYEHREGLCKGFTKRYALTRLVWFEFHDEITAAIQRESNMKHWPRAWKVRLILAMNPDWRDSYLDLNN